MTLYEVAKSDFTKIKKDVSLFNFSVSKSYETFEKNFEGLEFILKKTLDKKYTKIIDEIFCPTTYVGEALDLEDTNFDFSKIDNSIGYINPKLIKKINAILKTVSTNQFIANYNSFEFNEWGVYPEVWNDDESPNQAFNKRDLTKAIKQLKSIINRAKKNNSYIFVFTG